MATANGRQTEEKDKADAQRNAGKKEAEANSARAAAKAAEERQRARQ